MQKAYNPKQVEDNIYKEWEDSGFFDPNRLPPIGAKQRETKRKTTRKIPRKSAFSIAMPPPNVTGTLHVGHAVMLALQDIMIRYHRMKGEDTLWLPGTDHAAIATQTKVEKLLKEKTGKTRHNLGREEFLKEVEKFIKDSKSTIHKQIRKMGSSCDWSREAYTLDPIRERAVREVFKKMYDDGLIYRGYRIVNWCPRCSSTLADDEVEYKEKNGKLYYIKYILKNPKYEARNPKQIQNSKFKIQNFVVVATTRPETKLGDTAVAVNPADKRYKKYIGPSHPSDPSDEHGAGKHGTSKGGASKEFDVDLAGHKIHIKFITDKAIDPKFGTGAVGVTPAHSTIDWEMAEKNNVDFVRVIGEDGRMRQEAGKYKDLDILQARKRFIEDLDKAGLLEKVEDYKHNVGYCYRCDAVVEQLPSKQWFINVNKKILGKKKTLKELSIEVVKSDKIKIVPERFKKTYFHWMENLRDWCISRQIWFGHQIPVWYKDDEIFVGNKSPKGVGWEQDPDTLDTWFSSGLWTFSTLLDKNHKKYKNFDDWVKNSFDLKRFHPTSVMETGYDILFFWIARMILMTTYVLGEVPFENVYLHGLIRDEKGRKMSKSLGNVIDPLVVSEKYGTDAVRLSLVIGTTPGNDLVLSEEKIAGFRNFANKLWNITRYIVTQTKKPKNIKTKKQNVFRSFGSSVFRLHEQWILSRLNTIIDEVTDDLENFRFSQAGEKLRSFTWDDFADWYIEINKVCPSGTSPEGRQPNPKLITSIFKLITSLWHPFIPFVTEQLWKELGEKKFLMISEWPKADKKLIDKKAEKKFENLRKIIIKMRNWRAEQSIPPSEVVHFYLDGKDANFLEENIEILKKLTRGTIQITKSDSAVTQIRMVASEISMEKEKNRLESEKNNLEKYLSSLRAKLKNKNFISRAPKKVVDADKLKLKEVEEKMKNFDSHLKNVLRHLKK